MNQEPSTSTVAPPGTPGAHGMVTSAWNALSAFIGGLMGLLPHVLHHIGLFAGAALVTGLGGNLLFAALGLLLSIPMLRRLYRRFKTWKAPAIAVGVFATMFAVSALVVGPAITGTAPADAPDAPSNPSSPTGTPTPTDHDDHHPR